MRTIKATLCVLVVWTPLVGLANSKDEKRCETEIDGLKIYSIGEVRNQGRK